jgi:hypothetical protein
LFSFGKFRKTRCFILNPNQWKEGQESLKEQSDEKVEKDGEINTVSAPRDYMELSEESDDEKID